MTSDAVPQGFLPCSEKEIENVRSFFSSNFLLLLGPSTNFLRHTTDSSCLILLADDVNGWKLLKQSTWFEFDGPDGSIESLEAVYRIANALAERGVPLQKVYASKSGSLVCNWQDRPTVLMDFIPGRPFAHTLEDYAKLGAALGNFHREGRGWISSACEEGQRLVSLLKQEKPYEESRTLYLAGWGQKLSTLHDCAFPKVCAELQSQKLFLERQMEAVDRSLVDNSDRIRGMIYHDLNQGNILFNADGTVSGLIDFDQAGYGPLIWDVGNVLASCLWASMKKQSDFSVKEATNVYLKAYQQTSPLSVEEYLQLISAVQRTGLLRILRILRRHHDEGDRLASLMPKVTDRFLPRLTTFPEMMHFLTKEWIMRNVII